MSAVVECEWPAARLGEALGAFVPATRMPSGTGPTLAAPLATDAAAMARWVEAAARQLGLEALAFETTHAELLSTLGRAGTALLRLPGADAKFLVLVGGNARRLVLLGVDHVRRTVPVEAVRARFTEEARAQIAPEIQAMLHRGGVQDSAKLADTLLAERLRHVYVQPGWLLREPAHGPLVPRLKQAGLSRAVAIFLLVHMASYAAWILAWLTVGEDALQGRLDQGWLLAGGLMLLTFAALRVAADRLQAVLAIRFGVVLRQRLFEGSLAMDPQAARGEGVGQFLGRTFEAQALEALAISGGLSAATAALELLAALLLVAFGANAWALAALLLLMIAACVSVATRHLHARRNWTAKRRVITHDLIERMVGHRTRLAQQDRRHWHEDEDQALSAYSAESRRFDRTAVWLSMVPRVWLVAACVGLGWEFSSGTSTGTLAVMVGATLMAFESFRNLAQGLPALAGAVTAWQEVAPLSRAAAKPGAAPALAVVPGASVASGGTVAQQVVEGQGIELRSEHSGRVVLHGIDLKITTGDRILLEGPSGGGKSTLAALLAGLRRPQQGMVLLNGLDLVTLGEATWRRHVALAAQFQENHVVSETFAFNLLMGRRWPPTAADMQLADTICREIGLGDLLDRMPSGLDQQVGESGWQLSHGEKSRLFLARALLQDAQLVILDESFAALDPQTLQATLDCVFKRAPSLVVVAHP